MDKKYIINHTNSNFVWIYWQGTLQKRHITISDSSNWFVSYYVTSLVFRWHEEAQNTWKNWEFQQVGHNYMNAMIHGKVLIH